MQGNFTPVKSISALDRLEARSEQAPVVLFKHDTNCHISAAAYREMSQLAEEIALVDVSRHDDVAREIETRTGIKHESPQVLVLDHGQAVWSASHYDITGEAVSEVLQQR